MHTYDIAKRSRHGHLILTAHPGESSGLSACKAHRDLVRDIIRPHGVQAKPTVSEPGDQFEREADRVADTVMRMPEAQVQRQQAGEEEDELLQAKAATTRAVQSTPDAAGSLSALRESGNPLPDSIKAGFESRFGCSFDQVRVHTGDLAARSARDLNALAYTSGHDIVFAGGQYRPATWDGQWLLAHELAHVLQQDSVSRGAGLAPAVMRQTPASPANLWGKPPEPAQPFNPAIAAEEVKKFEQRLKEILQQLGLGKRSPEKADTEKFKDAAKGLLEPLLKTPAGKKILDAALSKKGLPLTIMVLSEALAGMIAAKTDIPSTPNIPLTGRLGLKFDFEGTFDKPKSVKVTLKYNWGGAPEKPARPKLVEPPEIPPAARTEMDQIDPNLLRKHTMERTSRDWEQAGPDEEKVGKPAYQEAESLPDARLVAKGIAAQFVSGGSETISPPLSLGTTRGWDAQDLEALQGRLEWLVNFVAARVQPTGSMQLLKFTIEGRPSIYVKIPSQRVSP